MKSEFIYHDDRPHGNEDGPHDDEDGRRREKTVISFLNIRNLIRIYLLQAILRGFNFFTMSGFSAFH